ncbi:hypothetical protein STPH2_1626 [Streptomyces sp. KO7888]|nr:hypothetical protein [Streptomyces sp. KO7888]
MRPGCSAQRPRKSARTATTTRSRLSAAVAVRSRSTKAFRSAGSAQRVYGSSNWSTISQVSASVSGTGSRRSAWVVIGAAPGVRTRTAAGAAAASAPAPAPAPGARRHGISPARSREDLPLPEGPKTAVKRCARVSPSSRSTSRSRPKNRAASSGS